MYGMGEYFRSGCHIDTVSGLLESTSESSWFIHDHPSHQDTFKDWTPDTYKIHSYQTTYGVMKTEYYIQ